MPEYRISAGIIPFHDESQSKRKYLLLLYPQGHWGFPKGHLEGDESLWDAASRELTEETGISTMDPAEEFEECVHYQYERNERIVQKSVHFFAAKVPKTEVDLSHEHDDFQWGTAEETFDKITFQNEIDLLNQWIEFQNNHE